MKPETSVYLNLVRFAAALIVAFDHIADYTNGLFWRVGAFGPQAVDVFFVLSGYVIAYAVEKREHSLGHYAVSRLARLYSVVMPALIIGFVLDAIGMKLRPAVDWGDTSPVAYLRCLLFTNQVWFSNVTPGYNGPFWSLGCEVWYYLIFAAAHFGRGAWRWVLGLLCAVAAGPRILLMWPLWLVGVAAWRLQGRIRIKRSGATLLWCVSLAVLGALVLWQLARLAGGNLAVVEKAAPWRSFSDWQDFFADYAVATLTALNFLGFNLMAGEGTAFLRAIGKPAAWLAGATFTLYLLHVPVSQFLAALSPWRVGTPLQLILVARGTFGSVFLIAELTERRKSVWRKAIGAGLMALRKQEQRFFF